MPRRSICVCSVQAPFIVGGAEILATELAASLKARGYLVDVVSVPFKWYPVQDIVKQALVWRFLDITESNGIPIDMVIPTKFPSYLVKHPLKVTWLFHQHREVYDLYGTPYCSFTDDPEEQEIRQTILRMDAKTLRESRCVFTISKNVSARLSRYNGIPSETLYPPPHYAGRYREGEFSDYALYAGRLETLKRVDLLIEAFRYVDRGARLVIAGRGPQQENLERQVERLGLSDRIRFTGFVPEEDLLSLYADAFAVVYAPVDEDYGYVTVEAFLSGKPVVTCKDSGGTLEFVEEGVTGFVVDPEARALAGALNRLYLDRRLAREMGAAGRPRVAGIGWDAVIDALTEPLS
ncbi:MAG TPA: glycosyltransferase family 4 protein [Vicinamibacteria bacterium]|nr:glycosyltransferase family 4 protein [Vicinamibacteria bacterium]